MYVRARVFVVLIRGKNWRFDSLKKEKCKEKVYVKTLTSNLPCSPLSRFRRTQAVTSARTRIKKQFKLARAREQAGHKCCCSIFLCAIFQLVNSLSSTFRALSFTIYEISSSSFVMYIRFLSFVPRAICLCSSSSSFLLMSFPNTRTRDHAALNKHQRRRWSSMQQQR